MKAMTVANQRELALLDADAGRLPEALAALSALIAQLGSPATPQLRTELGQCFSSRASVRWWANQDELALEDLAQCKALARNLGQLARRHLLTNVYLTRAKVLAAPHSPVHDDAAAWRALNQLESLNWNNWFADELRSDLAFRAQDYDKAARLALQTAAALAAEGWLGGVARCRLRAGKAYLELHHWPDAARELTAARDFFQQQGPPDQLAATHLALARWHAACGEPDEAWALAQSALTGIETLIRRFRTLLDQQRFLVDKLSYYEHAFAIGWARGGSEGWQRAWTVAERAKSFYLCQLVANAEVPLVEGLAPEQLAQLQELEAQIDACERGQQRAAEAPASEQARAATMQSLYEQKRELLTQMMQANPRWGALRVPPSFDLAAVLQRLDSAWTPLCYFWQAIAADDNAKLYIFYTNGACRPQCAEALWTAKELARLDECLQRLRGTVDPPDDVFPHELAARVLPAEVRNALPSGQRLLISPHGRLRTTALHALALGQNDWLINRWAVQYIPTLALLPLPRAATATDSILLLGCPENGFGDSKLVDAGIEIEEIARIWKARAPRVEQQIIHPDGSPEQAGWPIQSWVEFGILHLACHGDFPEAAPFNAGLRLGASAMRASEFFTARLRAALVALSACSLGRRASEEARVKIVGDEWVGLYLPLFYAGARTLLASLWDADSQTAKRVMVKLHTALSAGAAPAVALQSALTEVADNTPEQYWANWYLVGLPD